jgi:surfactin synthase thioesterase subunit
MIIPGRLDRTHETPFGAVSDFVEFVLCCLVHHRYLHAIATPPSSVDTFRSTDSLSGVPDRPHLDALAPSLSLFGHNLGGIIAFEIAREIEKATRVSLPLSSPPLHSLVISGCRPPLALTQFNKDDKSRKFSRDSNKALINRMIELGCVPSYLASRRDLLQSYLPSFRSGPPSFSLLPLSLRLSVEYLALESYRYLRQLGASQSIPPLKCDIVALCGSDDRSVSERLLAQWGEMTSGSFQHQVFDRSGHYYWLSNCHQGGAEEERGGNSTSRSGGGSVGGSIHSVRRKSHEKEFLTILIRASNPFHILLSEDELGGEGKATESEDEEDGQRSTVSSVTFQDSYRAESPSSPGRGRQSSPLSREPSARSYK